MPDRPPLRWPWLVLLISLAGCSEVSEPAPVENTTKSPQPVSEQTASRPVPRRVTAQVDWLAAKSFRRVRDASLPADIRTVLQASPVPALVPRAPAMLAAGKATRGPSWYALSMPLDDHTVFITGTRSEVFVPGISDKASPRPDFHTRITRTRGIVNASFNAFGVAYAIEVECARPFDDPRCTQDDYIRGLVDDVAVAGGAL